MKRWLFNLLSATSLLLFLATMALWARSHWASDYGSWGDKRGMVGIITGQGDLMVYREWIVAANFEMGEWAWGFSWDTREPENLGRNRPGFMQSRFDYLGFRYETGQRGKEARNVAIYAPLWSLALSSSVLPATWGWRRHRRRDTDQANRCRTCGYDLRASPDRCPECGTASAAPKAHAA